MFVDDIEVLTVEEAHSEPDRGFRQAFTRVAAELVGDFGTEPGEAGPVDDMPWLADRDTIERMTTGQMRRIVIQQQSWFYPKELRRIKETP